MPTRKDADRTSYYRQQASSCATAALTSVMIEIKQAYLDLEQGWLCLAPKNDAGSDHGARHVTGALPDVPPKLVPESNGRTPRVDLIQPGRSR